jgi:protein O-GlcNAc transferase
MSPAASDWRREADALARAGRIAEAIERYGRALLLAPRDPALRSARAWALARSARFGDALADADAALAMAADDTAMLGLRGICLMELGQLDAAIAALDAAIVRAPQSFGHHYNRANALKRLGHAADAVASFDHAIACDPNIADAHNNRGAALEDLHRFADAVASYDRALALTPGNADAWTNRGNALKMLAQLPAALASYERAVMAAPNHKVALNMLGGALFNLRRPHDAVACFDRLLAVAPETPLIAGLRRHCLMHLADWQGFDADIARIRDGLRRGHAEANPFILAGLIDDPALARACAELMIAKVHPPPAIRPAPPRPPRHDRIRIGYLSADFRDHPVMVLLAGIIEAHDRTRFEAVALSFGPATDDIWHRRAIAGFDRFIDVRDLSDAAIAARARELEIDIAVDLMGFTAEERAGIFGERPAPVHVNFLGYPGTFGGPEMDYIVADEVLVPPTHVAGYSEKLAWLPETYQPNDGYAGPVTPAMRTEFGLPETGVVLCAIHQIFKILPETFDRWLAILSGVPGSVLWMRVDSPVVRDALRRVAAAAGIAADRLVFTGNVPARADYLARLAAADLFLDTLPYNAHATASDALRAGLPVLTLPGQTYAARVGASLLTTLGLPELIATSGADFVARGIALGNDPARLAALRQRLAAALPTTPLFDPARFTRHLEAAFATMYARHCDGLAADHIRVPALPG